MQSVGNHVISAERSICVTLQPIFLSKKLEQDRKRKEIKPSNRQCVVYKLHVICVMQIMSVIQPDTFTNALPNISIPSVNTFWKRTVTKNLLNEGQFCVLKKCHGKFDFLVYEMLFIQELRPSLITQSDSISAKLFV